ncbi:MAG: hypothetical protein J6R59_10785 [Paludibacteraceae bacterium]|nr:hypothetical protein [Paludibacteraceae bacterium]
MGKKKTAKTTNVSIYTKTDYKNDQDRFDKSMKDGKLDLSSFQRLMINDICKHTSVIENGCIGDISMRDIEMALKHPKQHWKILLLLSDTLMRISPHYLRMNTLYSNMALFCWGLDLYDVKENVQIDKAKKTYSALAAKLESMNLKHEFSKIMKIIPYQDIYCGLTFENQSDFFIQQIDYKICELYGIQDGLYNFKIDLTQISATNLSAYPDYVQRAYIDYMEGIKQGISKSQWYSPPADKQICLKLNSQWTYPYPILIGLIKDILDLDVYKKLKLQSARTDNYKAIAVEVPIDENTVDKPLLTPETLGIFAEINRESMTDDIGLLHTLGSNATPISFKDSNNTRNNVSDSVDEIYNSAGISKELYNGSSSGTAVTFSIENDSGFVYGLYRQFERWMNRFIKIRKYNKPTFKFSFYLLDITIFNRKDVTNRYKESLAIGTTVIDKYLAALDMTPSRTLGSYITHEIIFDFKNHFIPLQSAFNSSIDSSNNGRPTNESKGETLDKAGEKTKDLDSNIDR